MKIRLTILPASCLLLACTVALGQADVLSSVPADAYGFVAVKSPQGIVDQIKLLVPVLAEEEDFKDPLAPIRQVLGDVDFTGPAAVVMPDCQKFPESEMPIAFLISAADAGAVLQSHKDNAPMGGELPEGVVMVATQDKTVEYIYLAVKGEFVVVAFEPDMAAELANGQGSFEVLPEVRQAYEQGKIVLLADFQRIRPSLIQGLNETRSEVRGEVDQESELADSKQIIERDMGLFSLDLSQSFVEQLDKFIYIVEVSDKGIFYNARAIFEADSPAAELINAQIGQPEPSYKSIPSGAFILAGALRISPAQLDVISDGLLARAVTYPSLAEKLGEESTEKLISDIKATYRQLSGLAFSAGMGSPATGMLNFVARFDVADAAAFKQQIKTACQSGSVSALIKDTGVQLIYTDAAESYAGVGIDTIAIRLADTGQDNPPANEAMQVMRVLPMVIGPDMSIRIAAPTDAQVLLIVGGGFERAERVINVANGHGSSLADYPKMAKARATMPSNRIAEIYLDFGSIFSMVKNFRPSLGAILQEVNLAEMSLVSASYSVEPNTLRVDEDLSAAAYMVAILVPAVRRATGQANAAVCATRVKGLDTALYLYANSHKGKYPDAGRWSEVLIEEDYTPGELFICPSVGGDPEKDNHYVLLPWPGPDDVDGNLLVLFESKANHNGRRNVVGGAHGVEIVDEADFQERLAKAVEALKAKGIEFNWQE